MSLCFEPFVNVKGNKVVDWGWRRLVAVQGRSRFAGSMGLGLFVFVIALKKYKVNTRWCFTRLLLCELQRSHLRWKRWETSSLKMQKKTHYLCYIDHVLRRERLLLKIWLSSSRNLIIKSTSFVYFLTGYLISRSFVNIFFSSRASRVLTIPEKAIWHVISTDLISFNYRIWLCVYIARLIQYVRLFKSVPIRRKYSSSYGLRYSEDKPNSTSWKITQAVPKPQTKLLIHFHTCVPHLNWNGDLLQRRKSR